jgi:hypothetical protein
MDRASKSDWVRKILNWNILADRCCVGNMKADFGNYDAWKLHGAAEARRRTADG